jgi:hypothetical protein
MAIRYQSASFAKYNFVPPDHGLLAWSTDPVLLVAIGSTGVAGQLQVIKVHVPVPVTCTNLVWIIGTAGVGLTSGQCFAGLWTAAGALVDVTSDQSTAWASTGTKTMPLAGGPKALAAGDYYWGYWYNGTTGPGMLRQQVLGPNYLNVNMTSPYRAASTNTGLTVTAPATFGAQTASNIFFWAALS